MIVSDLFNICSELQGITSTLAKKDILQRESNNESFKQLLKFLYDPMIITGISTSKINKAINNTVNAKRSFLSKSTDADVKDFDDLYDLLNYLSEHNTGRDYDISVCQRFLNKYQYNADYVNFISKIITKSLKLGIDSKIIRNVYGKDFIYIFEVQNAYSYQNVKLNDNEWFCLSQKMNGNRAIYKSGELISRQGKCFNGLDHIVSDIKKLSELYSEDMVFDGEIIRKNTDNLSDNENFTIGTGILSADSGDKSQLEFVIFDLLPINEFIAGESKLTYKNRLLQLKAIQSHINALCLNNIRLVPMLYEGTDKNQIQICLDKMDSEGKEGCMLARDVTYKCKRHNGLLKVKKFNTVDLFIIGYERGTGKYENQLGAIIVDYKGNEVGVGSGFTDEQRVELWEKRDDLIGSLVEIKYKDISLNHATNKQSLQFPVFVRFRNDKTEENIN